jgi:hypothetical protein
MLEDKEPLVDRVRAEYDRRRAEPPPLVDRPFDWPAEPSALGPLDKAPALFFPFEEKRDLLYGAFAGVELGAWDHQVLHWLLNADGDTVVAIVGMVRRAVALERAVQPPPED